MTEAPPRVAYEDATLRVGVADNILIAVWFDAPTGAQMRTVDRIDLAMRREATGGVGFLNVIVSGVPKFTKDVREEAARQIAGGNTDNAVVAHLILVGGFAGVAVRAFLNTASVVARPTYPLKIFSQPRECAGWVAKVLDKGGDVRWTKARMERAIDALIHPPGT